MIQTQNSNKDILAKLMAQENITVIHKSVPTAYFDVKNRTLCCPILKEEMSSEMYDLFMGHEVSHALNTPADGWHDAVCEKGSMFKGYLNVIEDVRIEKMIKAKYPGLRRSFYKGYSELATQDFFGTRNKDLQEYNLIDRINLSYKIGSFAQIEFSDNEQVYIDRCDKLETFEEVMELATDLFEKQQNETKDELESLTQDQIEELLNDLDIKPETGEESTESMSVELDESEGDDKESDGQGSDANSEDQGDDSDSDSTDGEESQDSQESGEEPETGDQKAGKSSEEQIEEELNKSKTDEESKENEQGLHKTNTRYESDPAYYELNDKIKYDNFIVGYKTIEKDFEKNKYEDNVKNTVKSFQEDNKKIVGYMVKEFEMKKAASAYNRSWSSKSGEIDMSKIHQYLIKDDIFNRVQVTPEGKNHGVVMCLDWSGSMSGTVKSTMEQATLLSMFCRRLSIPFRLFAFSDNYMRYNFLENELGENPASNFEYNTPQWEQANKKYKQEVKDWWSKRSFGKVTKTTSEGLPWEIGNLSLLEVYTDKQNPREFTKAMENWFQLSSFLDNRHQWGQEKSEYDCDWLCPSKLYLSGTPLDHTLVVMRDYLIDFKRNYNLDITSFITLTDGASHQVFGNSNPYLVDRNINKVFKLNTGDRERTTHGLLEWIKETAGVNTIGFYLAQSSRDIVWDARAFCGTQVDSYGEESTKKTKEFRTLSTSFTDGCYDLAILINHRKIKIDVALDEIDVIPGANKGQLKRALVKAGTNKMKQRVILNQFVGQMAV